MLECKSISIKFIFGKISYDQMLLLLLLLITTETILFVALIVAVK